MKTLNLKLKQIPTRKFENGTKEKFQLNQNSNLRRVFVKSYPNLQYSCPNCGLLDVILDLQSPELIMSQCLDCKNKWMEDYVK